MKATARWRTAILLGVVLVLAMVVAACGDDAGEATTTTQAATTTGAGTTEPDLTGSGVVLVPDVGGALAEAYEQAYWAPFEAATGIDVVLVPGEFDAAVVLGQVLACAPSYDIGQPNASTYQLYLDNDAMESIDFSLWSPGVTDGWGPAPLTEYAMPNLYFAVTPAWSTEALGADAIGSWADLWDTETFPGMRALGPGSWGAGAATFEIALLADGVAPEDLYPIDYDRAFASLDRLMPNLVKFWESGAESIQLMTSGEASAVAAWNGRVYGAQQENAPVANTWNQAILQYDIWVILKGAPNAENAQKLLAFVSQPERQAAFAELITYSPGNQAAMSLLSPERAALMPTSPANSANAIVQNYGWWTSIAEGETDKTNEQVAIEKWTEWLAG